jgi:hypothetical protein
VHRSKKRAPMSEMGQLRPTRRKPHDHARPLRPITDLPAGPLMKAGLSKDQMMTARREVTGKLLMG